MNKKLEMTCNAPAETMVMMMMMLVMTTMMMLVMMMTETHRAFPPQYIICIQLLDSPRKGGFFVGRHGSM
jgi:hypothetical protein